MSFDPSNSMTIARGLPARLKENQQAQAGGGASGSAIASLQARLQDQELRIRRLEAMVAHQNSTIAALQQGQGKGQPPLGVVGPVVQADNISQPGQSGLSPQPGLRAR